MPRKRLYFSAGDFGDLVMPTYVTLDVDYLYGDTNPYVIATFIAALIARKNDMYPISIKTGETRMEDESEIITYHLTLGDHQEEGFIQELWFEFKNPPKPYRTREGKCMKSISRIFREAQYTTDNSIEKMVEEYGWSDEIRDAVYKYKEYQDWKRQNWEKQEPVPEEYKEQHEWEKELEQKDIEYEKEFKEWERKQDWD